jgi:murein DD-endopeptidase MepM/ murein hydrolase activator NlpD
MKNLSIPKLLYFSGILLLIILSFVINKSLLLLIMLYLYFIPYPSKQKKEQSASEKSLYLSNFNPFTFVQGIYHTLGEALLLQNRQADIDHAEEYQNKVAYFLPFQGAWYVNGGITPETSHSWDILNQRFAYDFVIAKGETTFASDGKKLEDYYCFNQPILSPADGVVVKIQTNIRDYTGVGDQSIDWKVRDFRGNFVVIKHADKEFSFLAHFRKDSILVKKGDRVKTGQVIGLCGNSGHSTEPHLHFHLQNGPNFWMARGLPILFKNAAFSNQLDADFSPLSAHIDGVCCVQPDKHEL